MRTMTARRFNGDGDLKLVNLPKSESVEGWRSTLSVASGARGPSVADS
jgi:hypothetical protein